MVENYVYSIRNKLNNMCYIGKSRNITKRKQDHWSGLRSDRHPNPYLQNAWNKYGEDNFEFEMETWERYMVDCSKCNKETIMISIGISHTLAGYVPSTGKTP